MDPKKLKSGTNPLAEVDDGLGPVEKRSSEDVIYESIMRSGGEPFGAPWDLGLSSLTERVVKLFRQRSFFRFETLERLKKKGSRNRFTRHGSSRYFGEYDRRAARAARELEADKKKR